MTRAVIVWTLLLLAAATARADEDAKTLYERGTALFALHKFAEAAVEYEHAFELKPDPAILYNAAQAHRLANHAARALALYESLLNIYGVKLSNRSEVVEHIKQLRIAVEAEQRATNAPPAKTKPPTDQAERAAADKLAAKIMADRAAAQKAAEQSAAAQKAAAEKAAAQKIADERAAAERAATALAQKEAEQKLAAERAAERKKRDDEWAHARPRRLKVSGLALVVIGAAVFVTGGVFAGLASSANTRYLHPSNGVYSRSAGQERATDQSVEVGGFAAGGAILATGAALYGAGYAESRSASLAQMLHVEF